MGEGSEVEAERVLLAPVVNVYDIHTRAGRRAQGQRLVDTGGTAVWHDGDDEVRVTLPDQTPVVGVPRLSRVVLARTVLVSQHGLDVPLSVLLLVDEDGSTAARLADASMSLDHAMDEVDLERLWPRSVFAQLEARGVPYSEETFVDPDSLVRAHCGSVSGYDLAVGSRRSMRLVLALVALLVVIGIAVAVLTG